MTIQGIGSDLYLINNPIWVLISSINENTKYLDVTLSNVNDPENPITTNTFRLYPYNERLQFDLREAIKGNFNEPKHPTTNATLNNQELRSNYIKFNITFTERLLSGSQGSTASISKTFIRGGKRTQQTNVNLSSNEILKESEKIPMWGGFPAVKYFIQNKKIFYTNNIGDFGGQQLTEQIRVPSTCDPIYFRFLNTKGGYSFWLFEKWTENQSTKSLDYTERRNINSGITAQFRSENRHDYNHLGNEVSCEITVETRVKEAYFDTIRALTQSPEVYVYNKYGLDWARVINKNNDFSKKNFERMQKISLKFDVPLTNNPTILW